MQDFTLVIYKKLLNEFIFKGFKFLTFENFLSDNLQFNKIIIMRHDVDRLPKNALKMAKLEHEMDIKASYYFRITSNSFDKNIIKKIASYGHEIGYHYEDLSITKGDYNKAIELFKKNLNHFRQLYPIKTICMHGSPLSKFDNRLIWEKISYREFGIIGEPYYDVDYKKIGYLTDTGRKWNSQNENIRDKVDTDFTFDFNSTYEIINTLTKNELPNILMINIHPQRWHNNLFRWYFELISQSIKNIIKRLINSYGANKKNSN